MPAQSAIPELRALEEVLWRALSKCAKRYGISAEEGYKRLTQDVPSSLLDQQARQGQAPSDLPNLGGLLQIGIDDDGKAMLLRAHQNKWNGVLHANWGALTKAEKRSAQNLSRFPGSGRTFIRQRPSKIHHALAVFLVLTFEDLLSRKIPVSRSFHRGGSPCGPAFEAVLASLNLAQCRAAVRSGRPLPTEVKPTAMAEIVRVIKSKAFDKALHICGGSRELSFPAGAANCWALALGIARKELRKKQGASR